MRAPEGHSGGMMQSPGSPQQPQQQQPYSPPNAQYRAWDTPASPPQQYHNYGQQAQQPLRYAQAPSPNNQGYTQGAVANKGQVLAQYGDLPGYAAEEVQGKPHRQLTADELSRYNLPAGTIMMATQQEIDKNLPIGPTEQATPASEQEQIQAYLARQGLVPWTGAKQPVFAHNGQPVPTHLYSFNAPPMPHAPPGHLTGTQQMANHNQQYRALEQQYGAPPQKQSFWNKMESATGLDLDRDGDVGRQGKPQKQQLQLPPGQ